MRLPPWPFMRAILLRSTVLWVPVRLAATAVNNMVPSGPTDYSPYSLSPSTIAAVVALTTALTWLDCARHNEVVFLTNLGVSRTTLIGVAGILPLLYSLIVAVVVRL